MKPSIRVNSVAACLCVFVATPVLGAQTSVPSPATDPAAVASNVAAPRPAEKCLSDINGLDGQLEKDGYWIGRSSYGYGYYDSMGMMGYGYGGPMLSGTGTMRTGYQTARPGYEIRTLSAAANILARAGQQQPCEDVLATARSLYTRYAAELRDGGAQRADLPGWQAQQIAAAQPVSSLISSIRSDQLLGADVWTPRNESLGSVDDLVMDPKTGKIAYLVVARGGFLGFDQNYVPVPWKNFRMAQNGTLLVLDTSKGDMDSAPKVSNDSFATSGHFAQESQKVTDYWQAHLPMKG